MIAWTGVFPAVTTKLTQEEKLDLPALERSIDRLVVNGVSAVIVLPMLGENASLTDAEQDAVIRTALAAAGGRVPVLSGLAEISTSEAVATARRFEALGAAGLMAFPSLGYRTDPRETAAWYAALGTGCGLPIMIYNNPIAYGVDVTPAILERLADIPSIQCIKEETGDTRRITDLANAFGDRFSVFCGVDDLLLESIALGATGWVSGMTNAWPAECVRLFTLASQGRLLEARSLYRILMPAFHLDTDVKLVQYIKLAEHLAYGAPEYVRSPRQTLTGVERTRVTSIIETTIRRLAAESRAAA